MMEIQIRKKDGELEVFQGEKISVAVRKTAMRCGKVITQSQLTKLIGLVEEKCKGQAPTPNCVRIIIPVNLIHDIVEVALKDIDMEIAEEYKSFRGYKKKLSEQFLEVVKETEQIINEGDTENANRDSDLIDAKKAMSGETLSIRSMLNYELPKVSATAHENLDIYIHDLRDRLYGSINCCLFDMGTVLKGGFTYNGVEYKEPNSIRTAGAVLEDVMNGARLQQYGGFTIPEIDTVLAPYARKSFVSYIEEAQRYGIANEEQYAHEKLWQDLIQTFESIEHSLHMINNTFITFSFGVDTDRFAKMIAKAILQVRRAGLGTKGVPAVFPKLVFLYTDKLHGAGNELEDLFKEAVSTSSKCMYPDYLSLDEGYLGEMYHQYGKIVSPMGCRAFLSRLDDENGIPYFTGRANLGAITLNLPRFAIQAKGDKEVFYKLMEENFHKAVKVHQFTFNKMRKVKAKTNPLLFVHGGCATRLKPEDTIEKAIETFTYSIGYIGLEEVTQALLGKSLHEYPELAEEILLFLQKLIDDAKKETGLKIAMYSTPAESLCFKFLKADRQRFGVIEGVTDKEYYTNSYHCCVTAKLDADVKQEIESRLFHIAQGGRIVYNEFPHTRNLKAISQCIRYAMKQGLYYGVNLQLDTCLGCGHQDEIDTTCPECGSTNILKINRICGYLGYSSNELGANMINNGKYDEVKRRVDHFTN